MSSVSPVRSTPPSVETLTPPITPKLNGDANSVPLKKFIEDPEHVPADANIPDNYVSYTLKHQKSLPPISWDNWYTELNWLHVAILAGTPVVGLVGAYYTRLRWETAVWSVVYYYMTGLGKFWLLFSYTLSYHGFQASLRVTTGYGHTVHTTRRSLFSTFLHSSVQVQLRALLNGGHGDTVLTTVTLTPTLTRTTHTVVSYGHTLGGWLSSPVASLVLLMLAT